jgi:hypothetical protein
VRDARRVGDGELAVVQRPADDHRRHAGAGERREVV